MHALRLIFSIRDQDVIQMYTVLSILSAFEYVRKSRMASVRHNYDRSMREVRVNIVVKFKLRVCRRRHAAKHMRS
jgi:hypothetical protein